MIGDSTVILEIVSEALKIQSFVGSLSVDQIGKIDETWSAIAKTDIQKGFLALKEAVKHDL